MRPRKWDSIASFIGLKTPWQSREYLSAMRHYSGVKTMQIIGEIRYADAKSKGVGNSSKRWRYPPGIGL